MQTHLTRRILRCIIANEPIAHSICTSRSTSSITQWRARRKQLNQALRRAVQLQQERSFLSFFRPRQHETPDIGLDPGVDKMMEFEKRVRLKARLPDLESMEEALTAYAKRRSANGKPMPDTHAKLLFQSYSYVFEQQKKKEGEEWSQLPFSKDMASTLRDTAKVLCLQNDRITLDHVKLAQLLFDQARTKPMSPAAKITNALIYVLCSVGEPYQARDLLEQRAKDAANVRLTQSAVPEPEQGSQQASHEKTVVRLSTDLRTPWVQVLQAFVKLGNEREALRTSELAQKYGITMKIPFAGLLLQLYARKKDIEQVKKWFDIWQDRSSREIAHLVAEDAQTLRLVLECCFDANEIELGDSFVRRVVDGSPIKELRDEVLVWALMTQKSVDELDRMLTVIVDDIRAAGDATVNGVRPRLPDIQTINRLIECAIERDDPYTAERLIVLGRERGIHADAKTLVLQMEYRLKVGDVDGALLAYKHLQSKDLSAKEHILVTNQLIVALCGTKRHDYDTVMNVVADLADQRAPFSVDTVKTLAVLHIQRDEMDDFIDLIRTHLPSFTSEDRKVIMNAIVDHVFQPKTPLVHIWETYNVLRTDFDEMDREVRTAFVCAFIHNHRGDLGCQIFEHMRRHSRQDTMPTVETYIQVFMACARAKDKRMLAIVNNQLKLDFNVDLTTRLRNSLILAYSACGHHLDAFSVWEDIVDSAEGPSFHSLHAIFRACEIMPGGDDRATKIWQTLRKKPIDIDSALWASYLGARAGNGRITRTITVLEDAVKAGEVDVDELIVGTLYNVAATFDSQGIVEAWAKDEYPAIMLRLHTIGLERPEDGPLRFNINRRVEP